MNGSAINTLSQAETEDLLSSNMLILEVQKESQSLSPHFLDALLVEVDEKIKKDSNIHQHLADSLSALQGSGKIGTSELSSAVQSEIDEVASFNDNTSLSVTTPLSLSPSLTPLYKDKAERNQATQTHSSNGLPASDDLQRRCLSISDKSDGLRSVGPSPPPRSKSVGISETYKRRSLAIGQQSTLSSSDVPGAPHDSSADDQVTALELGSRFTNNKKKTRPKSAPVVRPDTLDIMDNNRTVHSGDSTLPRRNIIHPPISPSDPLSLSARVNLHLSGRPQPISPPALTSLYKSRNVPHFTVHSRPLLPGPEYCMPTSCLSHEHSRSSLAEEGDRGKAAKFRSRTWTEPQKNFRTRQGIFNGSVTSQKFSESGHSSTLPRRRVKSSSSQSQSNNTIDTHSTVSSHSSRVGSMGSSSGQNTPHIPSTPTFPRDIIEPIIHTKQSSGDSGDK